MGSAERGVGFTRRGVGSARARMGSAERGVGSTRRGVGSARARMRSAERGVGSAECGWGSLPGGSARVQRGARVVSPIGGGLGDGFRSLRCLATRLGARILRTRAMVAESGGSLCLRRVPAAATTDFHAGEGVLGHLSHHPPPRPLRTARPCSPNGEGVAGLPVTPLLQRVYASGAAASSSTRAGTSTRERRSCGCVKRPLCASSIQVERLGVLWG